MTILDHYQAIGFRIVFVIILILTSVAQAELTTDFLQETEITFDSLPGSSTQQEFSTGGDCFTSMIYRGSSATISSTGIAQVPVLAWRSPGGVCEEIVEETMTFQDGSSATIPKHLKPLFNGNNLQDEAVVGQTTGIRCEKVNGVRHILRYFIFVRPRDDTSIEDGPSLAGGRLHLIISRSPSLGYCAFLSDSSGSGEPGSDLTTVSPTKGPSPSPSPSPDKDPGTSNGLNTPQKVGIIAGALITVGGALGVAILAWFNGPITERYKEWRTKKNGSPTPTA